MTSSSLSYRLRHLFSLLGNYEQRHLPLDLCLYHYFRSHPSLGSKDRPFIAETAYALMRWKRLLDYIGKSNSWHDRYHTFSSIDLEACQRDITIPLPVRLSCPDLFFNLLAEHYGEEEACRMCLVNNTAAPTTVRVNLLKTTRSHLLAQWNALYSVSPTLLSPIGITFHKRLNFFQLPEFKAGLFEVQDEGSQLLAQLIEAQPGDQVLDYCAGSGGKSLAFAPQMQGKGQIYLHDIREHALTEARQRLRRAGVQNCQLLSAMSPTLSHLKKKMDWILVDAPCSGTGTWRRNPDMKWRFDDSLLQRLIGQQRTIFERALSFLHPNGRIVYATCSVLPEENQKQLEHFLATYSLVQVTPPFHTVPTMGGADGFFGVVLKKR